MKTLILLFAALQYCSGQCGRMVMNPTTGKLDCTGAPLTGSGVPDNATCTAAGLVYIRTGVTPNTFYDCPSAGGSWILRGGATASAPITDSNTTRNISATDCGKRIVFTAATTVTMVFATGLDTSCEIKAIQGGTGAITTSPAPTAAACTPGANPCIHSPLGFTTSCAQWGTLVIGAMATDEFVFGGCAK